MHYKAPDNTVHFLDDSRFSYLLPEGSVPITDEEVEALKPVPPAPTYADLRRAEYPPLVDLIDGLVKDDAAQIQAYKDACLAVKAKYPKP
jgi:hypothetical protein